MPGNRISKVYENRIQDGTEKSKKERFKQSSVLIKNIERTLYTRVMPSKFDEEYYRTFLTIPSKKYRCPLPIKIDLTDSDRFVKEIDGNMIVYIDYRNDSDYGIITGQLNSLDKKILTFIAKFRNVQKYQIQKELGNTVNSGKIDRALDRLYSYHLLHIYDFPRYDKPNQTAEAFAISRNGLFCVRYNRWLNASDMHRWYNDMENTDELGPIRYWKNCDTYQILSHAVNYKGYNSRVSFNSKKISFQRKIVKKDKITGQKQYKLVEENTIIPYTVIDGEIVLAGKDDLYYYDLFPVCTNDDVDNLVKVFRLWGSFKVEDNLENQHRYLMLIVDNQDMIERINQRWDIQDYSNRIIFLNLDIAQTTSITHSIFKYSESEGKIGIVPFIIDEMESDGG